MLEKRNLSQFLSAPSRTRSLSQKKNNLGNLDAPVKRNLSFPDLSGSTVLSNIEEEEEDGHSRSLTIDSFNSTHSQKFI